MYGVIDKLERQPREVSAEKLAALGVPPDAIERIVTMGDVDARRRERRGRGFGSPTCEHRRRRSQRYLEYLDALGVLDWVTIDLTIVRGLAYYTGIVFELFDRQGASSARSAAADATTRCSQSLGGADLPALGFGMGDVVLGELLRAKGLMKPARIAGATLVGGGEAEQATRRSCRDARRARVEALSAERYAPAQQGQRGRRARLRSNR